MKRTLLGIGLLSIFGFMIAQTPMPSPVNTGSGGGGGGGNPAGPAGSVQIYATSTTFGASNCNDNLTDFICTEPVEAPAFLGTGSDAHANLPSNTTHVGAAGDLWNNAGVLDFGATPVQVIVSGGDINTSNQVTVTHLASALPAAQGGSGVVNTATLTLGTSNQNWASLGTGIVKNTTTTGALSDAAAADVYGLWSGTCSSSTYLRGDGSCNTPSGGGGGGGVNAQTTSYTLVSGDNGKLVTMSGSSLTATLPASPPSSTWYAFVQNLASTSLTLARNGLTINGASANCTVEQYASLLVYTDGSNYFAPGCSTAAFPSLVVGAATNAQGSAAYIAGTLFVTSTTEAGSTNGGNVTTAYYGQNAGNTTGTGARFNYYLDDTGFNPHEFAGTVGISTAVGTGAYSGDWYVETALAGTLSEKFRILSNGHMKTTGSQPTLSGCGSGAAASTNSTDEGGSITLGTSPGSCVITFANAYLTNAPKCVVSFEGGVVGAYSVSTSALTVTATSLSGAVDYHCQQ